MRNNQYLQEQLATHLYEGVLTDDGWELALQTISVITKSPQVSIIGFDTRSQQSAMMETCGMPQECMVAYNAHYHQLDEALAFRKSMPWGGWYLDRREFGEHAMKRSAFYQEYIVRHDMSTILCNRMLKSESTEAYLSMQRRTGQPHFSDQDLEAFSRFIPHVQRAVKIRLHLQALAERAGVAALVLDQLQIPLLVLNEHGRVLLTNPEADALLGQQPHITIRQGHLDPKGLPSGKFSQMLMSACGINGSACASGALLPNILGQQAIQLLVLPLPAKLQRFNQWARPLALLMLNTPASSPRGAQQLLQQLYGLTPAEARVMMALQSGEVPKTIARINGISEGTVRMQIKAIFAKTGVNRQSELIRLMSAMSLFGGGQH